MLGRLEALSLQRATALRARQEAAAEAAEPRESVAAFTRRTEGRRAAAESALRALAGAAGPAVAEPGGGDADCSPESLTEEAAAALIDSTRATLAELEEARCCSSPLLLSYAHSSHTRTYTGRCQLQLLPGQV